MAKVKKAVDAAVDAGRGAKSALNDILDMSTEARKVRAAEQGFDVDTVYYHGSPSKDIDEFDLSRGMTGPISGNPIAKHGIFFSDDHSIAKSYGDNIQQVHLRLTNPYEMDMWTDFGPLSDKKGVVQEAPTAEFVAKLKAKGHDGIILNGGDTYREYMVFDPKNIRSVNAAFDPAKRESANLLAGLGGAAVLGGMAAQSPEVEAGTSSFARLPGRYGDRLIEFIKNPSTLDYQRLGKEVRDEYPGMPPGTPKFRTTIDEEGNTYLWKASDAIHAQMEPEIVKEFGVSVNQNNQAKSLFGDESGFADPMTLAVTAAITGAATEFYRRRESKKGFWQQRREELSELINAGDEFIRPAMPYINSALEALDKPMQGYYGVASALGALAEGNGLDASLQRGATVARQPIEETAQEYGGVLADEGYPLAGTALNTAMQVTGPF